MHLKRIVLRIREWSPTRFTVLTSTSDPCSMQRTAPLLTPIFLSIGKSGHCLYQRGISMWPSVLHAVCPILARPVQTDHEAGISWRNVREEIELNTGHTCVT